MSCTNLADLEAGIPGPSISSAEPGLEDRQHAENKNFQHFADVASVVLVSFLN
jgi:hypothetical protein